MRHHRDSLTLARHDHRKRPFHLVEILVEHAAEIGTRNDGEGIEAGAGQDVESGSSME